MASRDDTEAAGAARATWSTGDFRRMAPATLIAAELLCDAVPVRAGTSVGDIAAGTGNVALAAARRRARVVAVDAVPELLEVLRQRATFEGLAVETRVGVVEHLPNEDASFDVTLSTFGAMFSDAPEQAARELVRVTRSGGVVGVASWTPESFYGRLLERLRLESPGSPGLGRSATWGTRDGLFHLFGDAVGPIRFAERRILIRSDDPDRFAGFLERFFAPVVTVLARSNGPRRARLLEDLHEMIRDGQEGSGPDLLMPVDYLEAVAVRRPGPVTLPG